MNNPEYVIIDGERFDINTDFRIAIECNTVAQDNNIGDLERSLAIIYLLFGDKGLSACDKYEKLLNCAVNYLSCGKEVPKTNEKPDMDFVEDYDYIETSFLSDYGISLENTKMHWWKFFNLLEGLSNSEFGNCCILNRIRNIRNMKPNEIKDDKERQKIIEAQKQFELKRYKKENNLTKEQEESMNALYKSIGLL